MPRDNRDLDNASSSGQSKRPPLDHRDSDSQSDTTNTSGAPSHQHRTKTHQTHPKHHHHVGRLTARVPSTKAFHKQHAHAHVHTSAHGHGQPPKLIRRQTSRPASPTEVERPPHRRATSEVKLARRSSSANLPKSPSPTSLKRNRSHVEVGKRTRSSDKLKRTSSGTGIHRHTPKTCSSKTQVHFDLGSDDQEDEWVDASGSNSPYLSRKGSLTNGSAQSSLRHEPSTEDPRPTIPSAASQAQQQKSASPASPPSPPSPADKETSQHKEYITSRLLQRTPSHGAPPQMTVDLAKGAPAQLARSVSSTHRTVTTPLTPLTGSNSDELVSRFVDTPGSGLTSHGSFYRQPNHSTSQRSDELPPRPNSMANLDQSPQMRWSEPKTRAPSEVDTSALVPEPGRRTAAPLAETSRTQQKLNLQRASSVLEPGQGLSGGGGRAVGASPLIGVGGPGYDGGNSRDPRISKLLERTGMEYLVVRRYQNPAARSLDRLSRLPGMDKTRRIPRTHTRAVNGKHGHAVDASARHTRNVSMPDARPTARKTGGGSIRANEAGSSFEGDDVSRLDERLSGASLVAADEEDGTNALLRNLWEKSMDLSASTD